MPTYQYVARSADGRTVNGTAEAADQASVVQMLREKGLIPTSIKAGASKTKTAAKKRGKGGRTKIDDLVVFSQQMSVMIRAGLPLIEVLDILADQTERASLAKVIRQIQRDVEGGESLTEAMDKHKNIFDTFYRSMIKAGEASGMLDATLEQVAVYMERTASLQRKIKMAIMYPATVTVIATGITIFLLVKVVPVFGEIFSDLGGAQLPLPTRVVLWASAFIQQYWWMLLGVLILLWIGLWQWGKTKAGRMAIDTAKLKIPIFGPLLLKTAVAKFSRTLGTLIRSGVNILYALDIVSQTAGNARVEAAVARTKASIQSGESLTKPLAESGVFPPMVTRMIDVGEKTGALESMLTKIADFYEDQVSTTVAGLTSLIEPLLIVVLGLIIGFIVVAMFMPMFKMIELITS